MSETFPDYSAPSPPADERTSLMVWIARLLLLVAMGLAAYLLASALQGHVAGCGGEGGCDAVLQSHWSHWWKIPVAAPAILAYLGLLALTFAPPTPLQKILTLALCLTILGSALWFVALQHFVIGSLCKFCLLAHGCGAWSAITLRPSFKSIALPGIAGAIVALALLVGGQLFLPTPSTALWESGAAASAELLPGPNPKLRMYAGHLELDLREVPLLGSPNAPHVVVVLFDATCSHCKALHRQLATIRERYGKDLAIVMLPSPLDSACNSEFRTTSEGNANGCTYARLALAVWRADRTHYEPYLNYLMSSPTPPGVAEATHRAQLEVGEAQLQTALADPWVEQRLAADIAMYRTNVRASTSKTPRIMPQMIIGPTFMQGDPDAAELQDRIAAFIAGTTSK